MIKEEFDKKMGDFEEVLQKIAGNVASGILYEKLPPSELLKKTEYYVDRLTGLAASSEEFMLILKPEKAHTVTSMRRNLTQTLKTFKDILLQNTPDPIANSRLAFEQLKKALADGSNFLFLMREVRDNPSPLIGSILSFKKASETKGSVISIQASEDVKPLVKYLLGRIEELRTSLISLEKKLGEMKQIMRDLQEEGLQILSDKVSSQSKQTENKTEKRQLSLSNFKEEGGKRHDND